MMRKITLPIAIASFVLMNIGACLASNEDEKLTHHVIIAFDDALDNRNYKRILLTDDNVSNTIYRIIDSCGLLRKGDYFSIVNYCIGEQDISFDGFVKPSKLRGFYENDGEAVWCSFNSNDDLFPDSITKSEDENYCYYQQYDVEYLKKNPEKQSDWQKVVFFQGYNRAKGAPYSILTFANQFVLKSVKSEEKRANRIFIIRVTDCAYNGNDDIRKELNNFNNTYVSKDKVVHDSREVSGFYKFELLREVFLYKDYRVQLFEVIPCYSTSLNSVIDYPANFGQHRIKGGYKLCFDYEGVDSMFHLERLALTVRKDGEVICSKTNGKGNGNFDLELEDVYPGDHISIDMSCWLSMKDPVYNGIMMSPKDGRFSRLNVTREIELTDYANVFGLPLKEGFWWFSDDSVKEALIWQGIIVGIGTVLLVVFVLWLVKRASKFIPKDGDIKLQKIV